MAKLKTDWILFGAILALISFGIVMLYSASGVVATLRFDLTSWCGMWRGSRCR